MKKIMYVLAIMLVISMLVITATASISVLENKTASDGYSGGLIQQLIHFFDEEDVDDISDDDVNPANRDLGEWEEKIFNTVYQAESDGFVTAWIHADDYEEYGTLRAYTADYPPSAGDWSALRACVTVCCYATPFAYIAEYNSIMIPVRENDYWNVVFSSGSGGVLSKVYWLSEVDEVSVPVDI